MPIFPGGTPLERKDDRDNQRVLQAIHQALKPQGKFLLDVVSADFISSLNSQT
jgi:hypothetical protein